MLQRITYIKLLTLEKWVKGVTNLKMLIQKKKPIVEPRYL
jgi:hypothetical protein